MGLVKIKFEVMNEVQFHAAFQTAMAQVADLTEPFGLITDEFYDTMLKTFEAEGAFEEKSRWQDLSPAYKAWKSKHYPGRKILDLTGRMRNSLTIKGGPDSVCDITPTEMSVGTRVPYAVYHQTGTPKMPARKIIDLTQAEWARWIHIVHKYLFDVYDTAARATRRP